MNAVLQGLCTPTSTEEVSRPLRDLLVTYQQNLLDLLLTEGYPKHIAEDALQETALYALERIDAGTTSSIRNQKAWLRRAALNIADTLTKRRRFESLDIDLESPSGDQVAREVEMRDLCYALNNALGKLPSDTRALLQLWAEGYSFGVLGDMLGQPEHSVRRCFARVLAALRDELNVEKMS